LDPGLKLGLAPKTTFHRAVATCDHKCNVRDLWYDLTGGGETVTFENIDAKTQKILHAARGKLVGRYGNLVQAWKQALSPEGKVKIDEAAFTAGCEESGVTAPKRIYRLLLNEQMQRSITREDLHTLLIGVPLDEMLTLWSGDGSDGKPIVPLFPAAEEAPPPRELVAALVKESVAGDLIVNTFDDFKKVLIEKYGSLFAAWKNFLDRDQNGVVTRSEFTSACHQFGLLAVNALWESFSPTAQKWKESSRPSKENGEMNSVTLRDLSGEKDSVTLRDLDAETAEGFEQLERLLVEKHGNHKEGWRKAFERPLPRDVRVNAKKFAACCESLGFAGDATQLFKLLKPEAARNYLLYEDLWHNYDHNRHETNRHTWISVQAHTSPMKMRATH